MTRSCAKLFDGLSFYPDQPTLPFRGVCFNNSHGYDYNDYLTDKSSAINASLVGLKEGLVFTDLEGYWPAEEWPDCYVGSKAVSVTSPVSGAGGGGSGSMDIVDLTDSVGALAVQTKPSSVYPSSLVGDEAKLTSALSFIKSLLQAIRDPSFLSSDSIAITLFAYHKALTKVLKAVQTYQALERIHQLTATTATTTSTTTTSTTATATGSGQSQAKSVVDEMCMQCLSDLYEAGQEIFGLMKKAVAPKRYAASSYTIHFVVFYYQCILELNHTIYMSVYLLSPYIYTF